MASDYLKTPVWLQDTVDVNTSFGNHSTNETICNTDQQHLYFNSEYLYATLLIVGLLVNTLFIIILLRFGKMHRVANMYIIHLNLAGIIFLLGILFLKFTKYFETIWPGVEINFKFYMATSFNQFSISFFQIILSADRYLAVCQPISALQIRTPMISKVVTFFSWTIIVFLTIVVSIYLEINNNIWDAIWPDMEYFRSQTAFTIYSFILGFIIPLIIIVCFYTLVIRKLRTVGPKNKSKVKKKSQRKVTRLVLAVICVYVVCWLPYWITQVVLTYMPRNQCHSYLAMNIIHLVGMLRYVNSTMNPILYAFLNDNIKKSIREACTYIYDKYINFTLRMINRMFPRRHKQRQSNQMRPTNGQKTICQGSTDERQGEIISLARNTDHSTALTSKFEVAATIDITDTIAIGSIQNDAEIVLSSAQPFDTLTTRDTTVIDMLETNV